MNVPSEPSLAWVSTILFLLGLFLFVSGLNIIKIEKLSVNHGFKAWFIGVLLMLASLVVAIPSMLPQGESIYSYIEKITTEEKFIGIDKELVKKAKAGDMDSQAELGRLLWVEKQNFPESLIWDEKAAKQGDEVAQWRTGAHYQDGVGVKRDYKKAVFWYEKSAENNNKSSLQGLVRIYANGGFGVSQDLLKAYEWASKYNDLIPKPDDAVELLSSIENRLIENSISMEGGWSTSPSSGGKMFIAKDKNFFHSSPESYQIKIFQLENESKRSGILNSIPPSEYINKKIKITGYIKSSGLRDITVGVQANGKKANEFKYTAININPTNKKWISFDLIMSIPSYTISIYPSIYFRGEGTIWIDDISFEKASKDTKEKYDHISEG